MLIHCIKTSFLLKASPPPTLVFFSALICSRYDNDREDPSSPGVEKRLSPITCEHGRMVNRNGHHPTATGDQGVGTQWEDPTVYTRQIDKGLNKLLGQ